MKSRFIFIFFLLISVFPDLVAAQIWLEPKVNEVKQSGNPYLAGARKGAGFELILNDFGFSIGGQYRHLLSANQELTLNLSIGALRDVSEQTFTTYFSEIIPNKYNRIINIPVFIGFKQRLLENYIQDNLRLTVQTSIGPSTAFVYPYFLDYDGNGIRDNLEPVVDALSEWGSGSFKFGTGGELMIGMDFGQGKGGFTSFRFGIVMHYFNSGIQIMEPKRVEVQYINNGQIYGNIVDNAKPQKFFISPQFNLVLGTFW